MSAVYRCAGASCPGLPWKASDAPHPASCAAPMPFAGLATRERKTDAVHPSPAEMARERYGSDNLSHMSMQRSAFADGVAAERARVAKLAQAALLVDTDEVQAMIDTLRERKPRLPRNAERSRLGRRWTVGSATAILITNLAAVTRHDTPAKASRQAHRWLRRRVAQPGEWATILDLATGALLKRYELRNGSVTRMQ